jgi:lipoprotein-anchoring transpeptidase ErfK/SrfK
MLILRRIPKRSRLGLVAVAALAVVALLGLFRGGDGQQGSRFIPPAHAEQLIPAPPPGSEAQAQAPVRPALTLLPVARWLASGEYAWRAEETLPGPVTIVVDLRARTLSVYRHGVEIGRSSVVYGFDEKPTPTGVFLILEKDADHVSTLYDAPMPWMLRLTWDGVAIHGSPMADDKATHGCIGVPDEFGEKLFALARKGGRVIVHNGPPGRADYSAYAALPYGASL